VSEAGDPQREREQARRQTVVREGVRFSLLGGAGLSVLAALLASPGLATSILLGTLLACINFVLLARGVASAIDRTVAAVEEVEQTRGPTPDDAPLEPEEVVNRAYNASSLLRLLFFLAVVAGLIWLPPTEPMGLAVGVLVVLIGASVAMVRDQRAHLGAIDSDDDPAT